MIARLDNAYDTEFGFVNTMTLLQEQYKNPPPPSNNSTEEWIRENYAYFMEVLERYLLLFENQSSLTIAEGLNHEIRLKENLMSLNLEYPIYNYFILIEQINDVAYRMNITPPLDQDALNLCVNNYFDTNPKTVETLYFTLKNRFDTYIMKYNIL